MKTEYSLEIKETIKHDPAGNIVMTREVITIKGNDTEESYKLKVLSNDDQDHK